MSERLPNPQLTKMLQLAIVVRNVDESIKIYEEKFGIGPWNIGLLSNRHPPFEDMIVNGSTEPFAIKCAMASCYGMEIELIEPISDGIFKDWLEEHGPGVHHVAFHTRDGYEKVLADAKAMNGKEPWIRGQAAKVGMDFSYIDYREELGMLVEVYGEQNTNKPGNDY